MSDLATAAAGLDIPFQHSYAQLPDAFYAQVSPTPVPNPVLLRLNRVLADELGLDADALATPEGVAVLAGNRVPGNARPLAMAYAGHQFGGFVPILGDGRAILLGEVIAADGTYRDLQLKGAGRTPFSRGGDGRAVLGPVLREYVVSEAMAGFGIPTTRSLAMLVTGERRLRQFGFEPGAILVRTAGSHVRVGTFQYFHYRGDGASVKQLADYVIARHYPDCSDSDNAYRALLETVVERQASLVAKWLLVGFIHGVMNTDNTSVAGETLDYGPCAFLDNYDSQSVFSSIDHAGRYAYGQQPNAMLWNLTQFAQCLMPLLADGESQATASASEVLDGFAASFHRHYNAGLRAKLGLIRDNEGHAELARDLLRCMTQQHADFTNTFRALSNLENPLECSAVRGQFDDPQSVDPWLAQWRDALRREGRDDRDRCQAMRAVNPAYIPRNHRIEQAIAGVAGDDPDLSTLEDLLTVIARSFDDHPQLSYLAEAPAPDEVVQRTYCGT